MATKFHNYQGTKIEKTHSTIYIESSRELSPEEAKSFCETITDMDVDSWNPEEGITVSVGSVYHSERSGDAD